MTILQHLKRNKILAIKLSLFATAVLFVYGLYKSHYEIEDSQSIAEARLIAKRRTDAGKKCDVSDLNAERSKEFEGYQSSNTFLAKELMRGEQYDGKKHVLGFLHIQKTGGSDFASFVNRNTENITSGTKQRNHMNSNNAMFYLLCGLHSDWRAVHGCVEQIFKYSTTEMSAKVLTMIRNPLDRYVSEWLHVHRGSTWLPSVIQCSSTDVPKMEPIPKCIPEANKLQQKVMFPMPQFDGKNMLSMIGGNFQRWSAGSSRYTKWEGVSLEDFMACPENPATNRMVNMLADRTVIGDNCNGSSLTAQEYGKRLLESAKNNLKKMSFFGLTEHQSRTEQLLKAMLGVSYDIKFKQRPVNHVSCVQLSESQKAAIRQLNSLDEQLYRYAKDLFYERLKAHKLL